MTDEAGVRRRLILVGAIAAVHLVVLVLLILTARRVASLAPAVASAEQAITRTTVSRAAEAQTLRANLASLRTREATLKTRLAGAAAGDLLVRLAGDAQRAGVSEFRYEQKGAYNSTMQVGVYRVLRYSLQGKGSQDALLQFLNNLQQDSRSVVMLDTVSITAPGSAASGNEWQMAATVLVYTLGG